MCPLTTPPPPGDGEAPPGDTAGGDAAHPSDTGQESEARTSPLTPRVRATVQFTRGAPVAVARCYTFRISGEYGIV